VVPDQGLPGARTRRLAQIHAIAREVGDDVGVVVAAGFATGGVAVVKTIRVGMIVAIIVEATLVRALPVPATMRLRGRWNSWAPGPLGRCYARYGVHESVPPPAQHAVPGRA
jgi:trehalose monomycolate/heme transporter